MKIYKLKDVLEIKTGKEFKNKSIGWTPVYSSGGIISYINDYMVDFPSVLLPRVGTLDSIFYVDNKVWVTDNMYYSKIYDNIVNPKYLYFYLKTIDFSSKHSKTTQPKMTIRDYYDIAIPIPNKIKQDRIVSFFNYIESKIELN
ncbi:restriction endonuclease subunit S, partial [Metamycoplasma auris]|uniref:restriction endonuclease subunit S n=1 Tax=Metamycoplasma auris TaxID=51363 RepID=UPI00187D0AE4